MAVGVSFYFEDWEQFSYGADLSAIINRWRLNARAMNIDGLAMIDITRFQVGQYYNHLDSGINFERHTSIDELEDAYPSVPFVFVEGKEKLDSVGVTTYTRLDQFVHPDPHAIYVFGPNGPTGDLPTLRPLATWVYIPCVTGEVLYAEEACAMVMYDRYMKLHVT